MMDRRLKIRKRTFLTGLFGILFSKPVLGRAPVASMKKSSTRYRAATRIVESVGKIQSSVAIGSRISRARGSQVEVSTLSKLLAKNLNFDEDEFDMAIENCSHHAIRQRFSMAVKEDFSNGRIVKVDGWILSETEENLCLMAELIGKRC